MGMLIKDFKFHGYGFSILQLRMLAWDFRVVARLANVVVYVDGAEWCNVMPCYAIVPYEKCSNCSSPPTSKPPDGLEMMLVSFTAKAWVSKAAGPSQETHGPHARRLRSDNRAPISANDDSRNRTADPQLASRCAQPLGQARPGARPPKWFSQNFAEKIRHKMWTQSSDFDSMSRLARSAFFGWWWGLGGNIHFLYFLKPEGFWSHHLRHGVPYVRTVKRRMIIETSFTPYGSIVISKGWNAATQICNDT